MENTQDYYNLIRSIVNKYCINQSDKEDMFQEGLIGLMNAYDNFDESRGVKFSSFAYTYILGEVLKYVRESSTIKISRDMIKLNKSISKTKELMRQKLNREPTTNELSLYLEIEEEKILQAEQVSLSVKSLDYKIDDNLAEYEKIKVEEKNISPSILDLKTEMNNLTKEELLLVKSRYFEDKTQTETSKELGISQVQVFRKEQKVLSKLKEKLVA